MQFKDLLSPTRLKLKTLLMWESMWLMLFGLSIVRLNEHSTQGYYKENKGKIIVSGGDAEFGAWSITAISSIFIIYFGVLIVISLYRKSCGDNSVMPNFVICSKCRTPQYPRDLIAGHCPKCAGNVEDLEGYYERHPNLRNKRNKPKNKHNS